MREEEIFLIGLRRNVGLSFFWLVLVRNHDPRNHEALRNHEGVRTMRG